MKKELNALESLNGFIGWLTTRKNIVKIGSSQNVSPLIDLIERYRIANNLSEVTEDWPDNLHVATHNEIDDTNLPMTLNLSDLLPISKGDRWGFYDGRMPLYLAYIKRTSYPTKDVKEFRIYSVVIWYDVVQKSWRSEMSYYTEEEILGIMPVPKLEIDLNV